MASHEALIAFAASHNATVVPRWGQLEVRLTAVEDLRDLRALADREGLEATAAFGQNMTELRLSAAPPLDDEINDLRVLSDDFGTVAALESAGSGWAAADALHQHLVEVVLVYKRTNWCLSQAALEAELLNHWVAVARKLRPGTVTVGNIDLEVAPPAEDGPFPMLPPVGEQPDDATASVWRLLRDLADAQAWRNVAVEETVLDEQTVKVALHRDQLAVIPVSPTCPRSGMQLWSWLTRTADGNRDEAVRHVLRLLTATGEPVLPDGSACASLAERHRIALSREHAAEVERAIADSRKRTAERVDAARNGLATFIEDTTKTAQGALVASVGVAALALQQAALVPYWLLLTTTAAASLGVLVLVAGRRRRIADLTQAVEDSREELDANHDPLLPESERTTLLGRVNSFNAPRERKRAQRTVSATGLAAVLIMWSATIWLGVRDPTPSSFSDVVAVTGFYRAEAGVALLCEALGDDDPPSCESRLAVLQGVDRAGLPPLTSAEGVDWTNDAVLVVGAREGDVLIVTSLSDA